MRNTIIKPQEINAIVEYITSLLRDYCVLYEKTFNYTLNKYILLYSCNNNKTCIHVMIETTPINSELDKITTSYVIQGGKCEQMGQRS